MQTSRINWIGPEPFYLLLVQFMGTKKPPSGIPDGGYSSVSASR